jgi:hypothetical protein
MQLNSKVHLTLRDAAELACKVGSILKPDRVKLMNLFIGWGLNIQQKKKWLDLISYRE